MIVQLFERRSAAVFLAALAIFAAACAAIAGVPGLEHYASLLHRHALAERFSAIQITPAAIAYGFGAKPAAALAIGAAVAAAAVCCWFVAMRIIPDAAGRFCATCALLPFAVPFFHEHDLLVVFAPAIVFCGRANSRWWPLAAVGALLAATDWLGLAQRPDGTLQTLLLVGAFGAALVALRERPRPSMLTAPLIALALIGVAAVQAHAHAAPVWPDAMRSLPHAIERMDIASAWNAQQRASGLFARGAVWAGLRLCSLLGCAMLAAAAVLSSKCPADSRSPSPVPA